MSFQDQRPCVIYRGCMLRQGNGVPFFLPGPSRSSPWSFRRKGLSIGDLVILTEEGSYNFLFNVHAPADHELNAGNVPPNFEPLKIPQSCPPVEHAYYYNVGATVAANDEHATSFNMEASAETPLVVGVGGSASIELSTSRVQEAFLMLPDGATRYDAMNEKLYERYAEKYAESWREYVDDLGHHLPNGSLYLVTGCDKAPTWGLAVARKPSSSVEVSLKFSAFSVGAGFTYRTSWSGSTGTTTRSYPPQGVDLAQDSPPQENQCLFARGLTISFRKSRVVSKLSGTVRTDWIKGSPHDNYPSFLCSSSPRSPFGGHSFSRRSSPPSSKSSSPSSSKCNSPQSSMTSLSLDDLLPELDFQTADESSDEDEDESCLNLFLETFVSPAMRLSNGILDTNPEAHIAIVSDRMWMAHITSIPDGPRLVRKIMSERETIIHNGVAILQDTSVSGDSETVEKQQIGPLVGDVEGGNAGFSTNLPSSANLEKDHWETPSTCDFPPEIPFDGDRDKLCQDEFDPQDSQYYVTTRASFRASIKTDTLLRGPCTSGTRVETIDKIMSWARANDADAPSVFWLTGLAGTGKTTIAYTICERMWADSKDSQLIVPTICRNLAELFPSNATELVPVLQADSVLGEARIHEQIDDLLVAPWSASLPKRDGLPAPVVVIDALDENDNGVEFLKNLFRVVGDKRLTGIKFLVTRRPQPEIVDLCHSFQLLADMIYHLHEVPLVDVQDDIAKFLAEKLTELRDTNKRAQLTLRAGGLCLSAATVVRFISPLHRTLSQDEQREKLQKLLEPGGPSGSTLLVAQLCEQVLSAASFAPHPNTSRASYRKASSTPSPRSSRASSNNNLKAPEPFLSTASFAPHPNTSRASYRKSSSTPSPRSSRASSNNNLKTPDGSGAMGVFLYIGRKSWKTLRGGEMVWPAELEAALIEGLEKYQPDDSRETRLLGRFPMRNRFISEYIYRKTGRRCTVKQVASRLQQLRETYTGKRLIDLLSPCRRQVPAPLTSSAYDSTSTIHYDSASSNRSGSVPITPTTLLQGHTNCITSVSFSDNGASSPPRWPKLNHGDVPYGVATAVQDILMVQVAPLSAIPKAVGAAVKAFATRYENTAAREELRDRIVEIEALGHFPYLQEPIHNFQQVFETTDSLLERLIHASSEDELLRTVDKKFDSGLAMQNLAQTLQSEQTLHDKMKSQTLIDESGTVIVRVVRGGGKFSGSGNHFALTCHPRECEVMAGPPRTST